MKSARTEERERQNYERKQFYWAKMYSCENMAQLLWLNVKALGQLSKLCVLICVCVSEREREKIESKACVNEERWKAQMTDKEVRERKNEWCQWWMELTEFEWSIFHCSSHPLYSFRSPNYFILSFCDVAVLIYFIFSVAAALIPMNIIRSTPIPDRIPKHLLHFSLLPKKF